MFSILQATLLVSFLAIVFIIGKEKLRQPEVRQQLRADLLHFSQITRIVLRKVGKRGKKGIRLFLNDMVKIGQVLVSKAPSFFSWLFSGAVQLLRLCGFVLFKVGKGFFVSSRRMAKTIRQDLQTFRLPYDKEDFFDRLQDTTPKEPAARTQKKLSSLAPKRLDQAMVGFQEQGIEEPESGEGQFIDEKILEKKERSLIEAIAKNPKNPNFYKKLGKIYLQMQNTLDARQCFEYALKLGAQDPELRQLLVEIERNIVGMAR